MIIRRVKVNGALSDMVRAATLRLVRSDEYSVTIEALGLDPKGGGCAVQLTISRNEIAWLKDRWIEEGETDYPVYPSPSRI